MLDIKLKNNSKAKWILTAAVLAICSIGMINSYSTVEKRLETIYDSDARQKNTIYELGSVLAEGNYILYNEVKQETSLSDVLESYGKTRFDLARKYMECGVFNENGENLTDAEDSSQAAENLLQEEYYDMRVEYSFSENGELADVKVTGDALSPQEAYDAESNYVDRMNTIQYESSISDIATPSAVRIVYGMTEENLTAYTAVAVTDYSMSNYSFIYDSVFRTNAYLLSLFAAAAALLVPCLKKAGRWEGKLFRVPCEIVILVLLCMPGVLELPGNIAYATIKGNLYNSWFGGLPTFICNFAIWILFFGIVYWAVTCLREVFTMRTAYFRERTLTVALIRKIKNGGLVRRLRAFFVRQYDSLQHVDFRGKTNRTIFKIVAINFAILFLVCLLWFYGVFALLVYSVILFVFLKKYTGDLQKKYRLLLQSTNQLAEGHLDIPIEGDIGLFNPIQEELKKIQKGFKKAVEEEVKNERMKTELVTNVSHDLRTPLTAIITYTDLLKHETDEEKRKEYVDVLERKSLRLKVLIEDLFEISKAASKNVTMHYMKVDIVDLLKQVGLEHDDKIRKASLEVRWKLPDHKIVMWLDSQKTYRIFENLIVNIAKYAMPHTRVYIEMQEKNDSVHISMKNISATELNFNADEITDRFVRGDESRNTEGSGLGLAIAKSFVELQHGSLKIATDADLFKADIELPKTEIPAGEEKKEECVDDGNAEI